MSTWSPGPRATGCGDSSGPARNTPTAARRPVMPSGSLPRWRADRAAAGRPRDRHEADRYGFGARWVSTAPRTVQDGGMREIRATADGLRSAIERSGYYPGLVADAVSSAL